MTDTPQLRLGSAHPDAVAIEQRLRGYAARVTPDMIDGPVMDAAHAVAFLDEARDVFAEYKVLVREDRERDMTAARHRDRALAQARARIGTLERLLAEGVAFVEVDASFPAAEVDSWRTRVRRFLFPGEQS